MENYVYNAYTGYRLIKEFKNNSGDDVESDDNFNENDEIIISLLKISDRVKKSMTVIEKHLEYSLTQKITIPEKDLDHIAGMLIQMRDMLNKFTT